ncbi:MAG: GIY-YIG nuclease family protein [Propionibacteriaceae bacterium]|nr:GIY-YIG nuclease family protein [Propionibacteriaceae bacterium]
MTPVFRERGPLIYVLEFAKGEFYVGKSITMTQRFASHCRTWDDITAVQVRDVPMADLDRVEREMICQYRGQQRTLRNRAHNFGHEQPSGLDQIVPVVDQKHWALGGGSYDQDAFAEAARRPEGPNPKMYASEVGQIPDPVCHTLADAVTLDLAAVISHGIPDAVSLEQSYWTISDYPSTGPGRMATLNTGDAEILWTSREVRTWDPFEDGSDGPFLTTYLNISPDSDVPDDLPWVGRVDRSVQYYGSTAIDRLHVMAGGVHEVLEDQRVKMALRDLVLKLMRSGVPTRWGRFHSMELARRAYTLALRTDPSDACWLGQPTAVPEGRFPAAADWDAWDHTACRTRASISDPIETWLAHEVPPLIR